MRFDTSWPVLALALAGAACEKVSSAPEPSALAIDESEPSRTVVVGVDPGQFACDSVAPEADVEAAVGVEVEATPAQFTPPEGVPAPCNYVGTAPPQPSWSFDLDCRAGAIGNGAQMMAQYAAEPSSRAVMVGRSGIDHQDSVLLFIDDDAPCYGRVLGPGADKRLALARVVAGKLRESNAPTRPTIRSVR